MTDRDALRTPHQIAIERAIALCDGRQEELSARTGIGRSVISEILGGTVPMKPWMAAMIEFATDGKITRKLAMPEVFGTLPKRSRLSAPDKTRDLLLDALRSKSVRAKAGGGAGALLGALDRLGANRAGELRPRTRPAKPLREKARASTPA